MRRSGSHNVQTSFMQRQPDEPPQLSCTSAAEQHAQQALHALHELLLAAAAAERPSPTDERSALPSSWKHPSSR